jgi:hypothetical protein
MEKSVEDKSLDCDASMGVKCESTSDIDSLAASKDKAPCLKMGGTDDVLNVEDGMRPRSLSSTSSGVKTV